MKEYFKNLQGDKTIIWAFYLNVFFIIAPIIYILFSYTNLPPLIPIFNQLPWGNQRLGETMTIFIPVLAALLVLAANIVASASIYKNIPLISRMLMAISLLVGSLTFLFTIRTITLIT